jgi:hypothetical protein
LITARRPAQTSPPQSDKYRHHALAVLRAICDSLNDERGTGGQSKFARLLKWRHSTVWRKLTGKSPITESDALAIQKAVELAEGR